MSETKSKTRFSRRGFLGGMGVAIMSTPKGVMSGAQARRQGVGGEVLAYVW